ADMRHLPYFCRGEVVKGFGRGSKELGIPTGEWGAWRNGAARATPALKAAGEGLPTARPSDPETHIIHTFKDDFYGEILSIVIIGYIRSEKNFSSSEALISAIQEDIEEAKRQLDLPEHLKLKEDNFFHLPEGKPVNH
ncbi:RIFK kinase, partial [Phaetusa simplex]|nr:RIFK kinase [Phaetusa simplex]